MIVDSHVHLYHPSLGDYAWPPPGDQYHRPLTPEMLAQDAGPELTAAVMIGCSNEFELNFRLMDWLRNEPLVAAFIAQVALGDPACAEYTHRYAQFSKYRGFRVSSGAALPHAGRLGDALTPGALVELLGPWQKTLLWADVIAAHPQVSFVIEHFGGYQFDGTPMPEGYGDFCRVMAALPNVSIKLSGFLTLCLLSPKVLTPDLYQEAFSTALEAFGPERCMYGSDWPVTGTPYAPCLSLFRALAGDKAEQVMGLSARRIYRLDEV